MIARSICLCLIPIAIATSTGCRTSGGRALVAYDTAAGLFEEAMIRYEIDAGQEGLPVAATRIEGQQVSYVPLPTTPLPDRSVGKLEIRYPHPRLGSQAALATVRIESEFNEPADSGAGKVEETWQLDIDQNELAQVVAALNASGYFNPSGGTSDEVKIETRINDETVRRRWQHVPALDWLISRARAEGQLVAYQGSGALPKSSGSEYSAVAALEQLQREGQYHVAARDALGAPAPQSVATSGALLYRSATPNWKPPQQAQLPPQGIAR